jgi:hypothetical protein
VLNLENCKLTIEELKQMKGYENIEEETALKLIDTIYLMSIIAFNVYKQKK